MSAAREILAAAVLVTGNQGKVDEARRACGFHVAHRDIDLPEIQDLDLHTVLQHKGREAWRRLRRPLVVEETGLELTALNGFPGPLVKWMLAAIGGEGIAAVAAAMGDRRATAHCGLLYLDSGRSVAVEARTEGTLVRTARGTGGFGWDPVFRPDGDDRTYAELSGTRKNEIGHRGKAWRALIAALDDPSRTPST